MRPALALRRWPINRPNNVPYYQRLFQNNDGKRQWWKTKRSAYMLYPLDFCLYTSCAGGAYMCIRMMFGHKTWFGEG